MSERNGGIRFRIPASIIISQMNDIEYVMYDIKEKLAAAIPLDCDMVDVDERTFTFFLGFVSDAKEDVEELRKSVGYLASNVEAMERVEPVAVVEGKYGL